MDNRVWCLFDVDGVLNVLCSTEAARRDHLRRFWAPSPDTLLRYRMQLHTFLTNDVLAEQYPHLRPGWATSWWKVVNETIGKRVGLGPWPVAGLGYFNDDPRASKVDGIVRLVGDDPFVWIDDAPMPGDADRLAALPQPALLLVTDPGVGLTPDILAQADAWAAGLGV